MKRVFKHQNLQVLGLKSNTYLSYFHPLEVVGRGSETQLLVCEEFKYLTSTARGSTLDVRI